MRHSADFLYQGVARIASKEEVSKWQKMAFLLEIKNVSAQWAEALVHSEIETPEDLFLKGFDRLSKSFDAVLKSGLIPSVPTPAEIA